MPSNIWQIASAAESYTCRFASGNSPPAEAAPGRTRAAPWLCPRGPPPRRPALPAPPPACLASPGLPSASPLTVETLPQLFADSPPCSPFALALTPSPVGAVCFLPPCRGLGHGTGLGLEHSHRGTAVRHRAARAGMWPCSCWLGRGGRHRLPAAWVPE